MENIKQNTMKYKILFILSFMFLILLLFNTNSFASFSFEYNGTTHVLPNIEETYTFNGTTYNTSNFKHKLVLDFKNGSDNVYQVFLYNCSSDTCIVSKPYDDLSNLYFTNIESFIQLQKVNSGDLEIIGANTSPVCNPYYKSFAFEIGQVVYSDIDIYLDDGETVLFYVPAQEVLAQVLVREKAEKPEMVMKEIVVILPLIIVIVVSLVGLRKALTMLSTLLHRA